MSVERRAPRVQPVAQAAGGEDDNWMIRGRRGVEINKEVQVERERQRNTPRTREFSCQKGETRELILLDASIEVVPFVWEHAIPGEGNNWKQAKNVLCPKEFGNCAVCERAEQGGKNSRFKNSYYCMKLSVLDISGYIDKETNEHVDKPFRMIMTVKSEQINDFDKLAAAAIKQHGTMRGMYLVMHRDNGDTSPRIGKPEVQEGGVMFQMFNEAALAAEFGHPAILREGTSEVIMAANGYLQPHDYAKVFPRPDPSAIRRVWGGGVAQPGSQADNDAAWGDETDEGTEAQAAAPTGPTRQRTRPGTPAASTAKAPETTTSPAPATRTRTRPPIDKGAETLPEVKPEAGGKPAQGKPAGGTRAGVSRTRVTPSSVAGPDDDIPF